MLVRHIKKYMRYIGENRMEKALISFSFDDGRADNIDAFDKVLLPKKIPVTLNVTTGYIDGSCPFDKRPSDKPAMTVADIQRYAENPYVELALHGDCHLNTEEDIETGRQKIIKWLGLPENQAFGFASPGSKLNLQEFILSTSKLFREHIIYVRHSLRIEDLKKIRVLSRKAGRIWHNPIFYEIAYGNTLMDTCTDRIIYSIPVLKDTTVSQLKAIIEKSIEKQMAVTFMFHSIKNDTSLEDNWSWSTEKLISFCDYILPLVESGEMQCVTTRELYNALIKN